MYDCKIKCTEASSPWWTVGKEYVVDEDGLVADDFGDDCWDVGMYFGHIIFRNENGEDKFEVVETCITKIHETTDDNVHHPNHYNRGGIECIEAIKSATMGLDGFEGYCTGNMLKYIWRWKNKNGVEDLNKAKQYADFLINYEENVNEKINK